MLFHRAARARLAPTPLTPSGGYRDIAYELRCLLARLDHGDEQRLNAEVEELFNHARLPDGWTGNRCHIVRLHRPKVCRETGQIERCVLAVDEKPVEPRQRADLSDARVRKPEPQTVLRHA